MGGAWSAFISIATTLALVLSLAVAQGDQELVIVRPSDPVSLDAQQETTAPGAWVVGNVIEPLITLNADMEIEPRLATDWEFVDDDRLRFHLREGVTFHDGTPFNAEAVKFTWDRALFSDPLGRWARLAVPILLGVVLVVLLSMELVPGDPVALMLGEFATPEAIAATRAEIGLDRPLAIRYVEYIADVVRGDLGTSIKDRRPVATMIAETLPATAQLAGAAVLLSLLVGVPLGVASAARPGGVVDNLVRVVSLAGLSMPVFWTGLVFIVFFSVNLGWFPVAGRGSLRHLVLPAVTLALPSIAILARMTRASLLEVLQEDYVRTARSKGLTRRTILYKHALRNALIPVVTALGLQLGQMLGGAVLTETVFSWPGLGRLTVFAIFNRDFILVQGVVLVLATVYVTVNLLVDLSYGLFDPRVSYS